MLPRIRKHIQLPLGVGFGIRDAASARADGEHADAVIIGTKIIQLLQGQPAEAGTAAVAEFIAQVRGAMDAVSA
jgi:tryptophan synthase alpha chain